MDKKILTKNIDKIHTTTLGVARIRKNLDLKDDVISYVKKNILNENTFIYKQGKNYYCVNNNIIITINSYSFTIITAKKKSKLVI